MGLQYSRQTVLEPFVSYGTWRVREARSAMRVVAQSYPSCILNLAAYKDVVMAHASEEGVMKAQFEVLDVDGRGTVHALDVISALLVLCRGIAREKVNLAFAAFDVTGYGLSRLARDEVVMMITSFVTVASVLKRVPPVPPADIQAMADGVFKQSNTPPHGDITADMFVAWLRRDVTRLGAVDTSFKNVARIGNTLSRQHRLLSRITDLCAQLKGMGAQGDDLSIVDLGLVRSQAQQAAAAAKVGARSTPASNVVAAADLDVDDEDDVIADLIRSDKAPFKATLLRLKRLTPAERQARRNMRHRQKVAVAEGPAADGVRGVFSRAARLRNQSIADRRHALAVDATATREGEEEKKGDEEAGPHDEPVHAFVVMSGIHVSVMGKVDGVRRKPLERIPEQVTAPMVRRMGLMYGVPLNESLVCHAQATVMKLLSLRASGVAFDGQDAAWSQRSSMMAAIMLQIAEERAEKGEVEEEAVEGLPDDVLTAVLTGDGGPLGTVGDKPPSPVKKVVEPPSGPPTVHIEGGGDVVVEDVPGDPCPPGLPPDWQPPREMQAAFEMWVRRALLRPWRGANTIAGTPWAPKLRFWEVWLVAARLHWFQIQALRPAPGPVNPSPSQPSVAGTTDVLACLRAGGRLSKLPLTGPQHAAEAPLDAELEPRPAVINACIEVDGGGMAYQRLTCAQPTPEVGVEPRVPSRQKTLGVMGSSRQRDASAPDPLFTTADQRAFLRVYGEAGRCPHPLITPPTPGQHFMDAFKDFHVSLFLKYGPRARFPAIPDDTVHVESPPPPYAAFFFMDFAALPTTPDTALYNIAARLKAVLDAPFVRRRLHWCADATAVSVVRVPDKPGTVRLQVFSRVDWLATAKAWLGWPLNSFMAPRAQWHVRFDVSCSRESQQEMWAYAGSRGQLCKGADAVLTPFAVRAAVDVLQRWDRNRDGRLNVAEVNALQALGRHLVWQAPPSYWSLRGTEATLWRQVATMSRKARVTMRLEMARRMSRKAIRDARNVLCNAATGAQRRSYRQERKPRVRGTVVTVARSLIADLRKVRQDSQAQLVAAARAPPPLETGTDTPLTRPPHGTPFANAGELVTALSEASVPVDPRGHVALDGLAHAYARAAAGRAATPPQPLDADAEPGPAAYIAVNGDHGKNLYRDLVGAGVGSLVGALRLRASVIGVIPQDALATVDAKPGVGVGDAWNGKSVWVAARTDSGAAPHPKPPPLLAFLRWAQLGRAHLTFDTLADLVPREYLPQWVQTPGGGVDALQTLANNVSTWFRVTKARQAQLRAASIREKDEDHRRIRLNLNPLPPQRGWEWTEAAATESLKGLRCPSTAAHNHEDDDNGEFGTGGAATQTARGAVGWPKPPSRLTSNKYADRVVVTSDAVFEKAGMEGAAAPGTPADAGTLPPVGTPAQEARGEVPIQETAVEEDDASVKFKAFVDAALGRVVPLNVTLGSAHAEFTLGAVNFDVLAAMFQGLYKE